jgi:predicted dinucleotide-utilizing enzyme
MLLSCFDQIAFVWNRTFARVEEDSRITPEQQLQDLDDFASKGADLIVEAAHPSISRTHGPRFLATADYLIGSPTCFADIETDKFLLAEVSLVLHRLLYALKTAIILPGR